MAAGTIPTCAGRGAPVRMWPGTPPPDWKPGMRPPCIACGVGAAEPCKTPLPGEVFRGEVDVYDDGEVVARPLGTVMLAGEGIINVMVWRARRGEWTFGDDVEYEAVLHAAVLHLATENARLTRGLRLERDAARAEVARLRALLVPVQDAARVYAAEGVSLGPAPVLKAALATIAEEKPTS